MIIKGFPNSGSMIGWLAGFYLTYISNIYSYIALIESVGMSSDERDKELQSDLSSTTNKPSFSS